MAQVTIVLVLRGLGWQFFGAAAEEAGLGVVATPPTAFRSKPGARGSNWHQQAHGGGLRRRLDGWRTTQGGLASHQDTSRVNGASGNEGIEFQWHGGANILLN